MKNNGCFRFSTPACGENCPVGRKAVIVNGVRTGKSLAESPCPLVREYEERIRKEAQDALA